MPFDANLGFVVRTFEEWLDVVGGYYEAESGITLDQSQPSPTLDVARTLARTAKAIDDDGAGTYGSGFVRTSTGAALQNLLEPFIGPPLADTPSTVTLPLAGVAATLVTAGALVTLDSDGAAALPWVLQADVVIPGDGVFAYSVPGPKTAAAASTWTKQTVVAGWNTVGPNAAAAAKGRFAETPIEYRQRFADATSGTRLLAAVLAVPGVTSAAIFENPTDIPDAFWGATHWVEVLVEGGDDQAIADAIQSARTFTVWTVGTTSVVVDASGFQGGTTEVRFSRPNEIEIWVSQTITKGEGYSSDTSATAVNSRENAIREQLLAVGNARPTGLDLTAFHAGVITFDTPDVPGIADVTTLLGLVNPPVDTVIVAGPRDKIVLVEGQILLSGV